MPSCKQPDLLWEFKSKCRQLLGKLPDSCFDQYIQGTSLMFNLTTFKAKDIQFAQILFTLPITKVQMFRQYLSDEKIEPKMRDHPKRSIKQKAQFGQKITKIFTFINDSLIAESNNQKVRTLRFVDFPVESEWLHLLTPGIEKTNHLKDLTFSNCNLNDSALQILQNSLSINISLTSLNLSMNSLKNCSQSIVNILSVHGQRKHDIRNLYLSKRTSPEFNISNTGIYEINLEGNNFTNQFLDELITFLYEDQWVKSIKLKNNNVDEQKMQKFTFLINQNSTLLNLDLRQNPGFIKKYSKIIFHKLKQNIQNIKHSHESPHKISHSITHQNNLFKSAHSGIINQSQYKNNNSSEMYQNSRQNSTSLRQFNKQPNPKENNKVSSKQKLKINTLTNSPHCFSPSNVYPFNRTLTDKKIKSYHQNPRLSKKGSFAQINSKEKKEKKMNKTAMIQNLSISNLKRKSKQKIESRNEESHVCGCGKCKEYQMKVMVGEQKLREMRYRVLKAEKESVELEIELKRLKKLLTRDMDVSAITPRSTNRLLVDTPIPLLNLPNLNHNTSTSFNRLLPTQANDSDILSKIQLMVLQLTKIMQTVELFQNTQNTIQHPFSHVNSFSKTVSLYQKPKDLMEVQQEILEDENLHLEQFGQDSDQLGNEEFIGSRDNIIEVVEQQESQ